MLAVCGHALLSDALSFIKVTASRKPLILILRTRFARSGEFAIHTLVSSKVPSMRSWVLSTIVLARNAYNEAMLSTVS